MVVGRPHAGSSSNLVVANFVAEVVKTFEKLLESKLLTSSAMKLSAGQPLEYVKSLTCEAFLKTLRAGGGSFLTI